MNNWKEERRRQTNFTEHSKISVPKPYGVDQKIYFLVNELIITDTQRETWSIQADLGFQRIAKKIIDKDIAKESKQLGKSAPKQNPVPTILEGIYDSIE